MKFEEDTIATQYFEYWCCLLFTLTLALLGNGGHNHSLRHIVHLHKIPNIISHNK